MKSGIFGLLICCLGVGVFAQTKGEIFEGSVEIKDGRNSSIFYEIPLAPGKWIVESVNTRTSRGPASAEMKEVRLIRTDSGVLREALEVVAKVDNQNIRWMDEPCKAEPVLYKNNYGTGLWKQKCLTIRPSTFLQSDNAVVAAAIKYLSDNEIKHDFNSLGITYTRYGDFGKFLILRNHIFPSNFGLENPVVSILSASPYHPSLIDRDVKKRNFVDSVSKYFERVVVAYDAAYEGKDMVKIEPFFWSLEATIQSDAVGQK